jgi:hypothetical protein
MNNRSLFRALAIAALVIAGAAALGIGAYNAGVAQGIAQSGALAAQPSGTPYPVYPYLWYRPWGFGFFPIFPFFFFFLLFFFVLRGLFWRGPWRGGWGYRYEGVPPAFEEWHRRAHANPSTPPPSAT